MTMNNNDILLDIKDLEVTYDTEEGIVHAVNNISFGVVRGKTLGIVGETGAKDDNRHEYFKAPS